LSAAAEKNAKKGVGNPKRGVSYGKTYRCDDVTTFTTASWYYNWHPTFDSDLICGGDDFKYGDLEYVPMIWGKSTMDKIDDDTFASWKETNAK